MTYTQDAKDLYDAFQDAMGNWDRVPFERLSVREMEAWQTATGYTSDLEDRLEESQHDERKLQEELEDQEAKTVDAEENLARAIRDIERLESEVKALKAQINTFDAAFTKTPEPKKAGKR